MPKLERGSIRRRIVGLHFTWVLLCKKRVKKKEQGSLVTTFASTPVVTSAGRLCSVALVAYKVVLHHVVALDCSIFIT